MKSIDGQLSFFDEADTLRDESAGEPEEDQVIPPRPRKKKTKGQREMDLKAFPEEVVPAQSPYRHLPEPEQQSLNHASPEQLPCQS